MAGLKSKLSGRLANPIETATTAGRDFIASTTTEVKDQFAGINDDFFSQLLGLDFEQPEKKSKKSGKSTGEMKAGEIINLTELTIEAKFQKQPKAAKQESRPDILPGIDYRSEIVHGSERISRTDQREMDKKINEIMNELQRLVSSSSTLSIQFAEVSVQQAPTKAGKYHLNFFEWLLIEVRNIRMKIEDSGAWLSVMKSKKSGRKYGAMAKKHGTSFTLSNERTAATQTG